MPVASVVIPAHNEAGVIGRCLRALLEGAPRGSLEIVVVCNGCTDDTAEEARRTAPGAKVVELPRPSKRTALNVGDREAITFPRFYVDADVEMPYRSVREVVEVLTHYPCAAPKPVFATGDRRGAIRRFYRLWQQMPYLAEGMVGSGVYALSAEGRQRFDEFPPITADDQFVMQLFAPPERCAVATATFVVHPPRTVAGLVRMRTRAYRGNAELAASGLARTPATGGAWRGALQLGRDPARWADMAVFLGVNLVAKWNVRRYRGGWERDESGRA